ncbi:FliH/SctL family protein [Tepidibacillus marianensis]|uniref:FliH/SctL family protein n=1 Tax=Tepidibacillus marianensis TaxID=3131995 RepID=UPI0030CDD293
MSRIYKSVDPLDQYEIKIISFSFPLQQKIDSEVSASTNNLLNFNKEHLIATNQVIQDAEETAKRIIEQAKQKAEEIQQKTISDINCWWEQEKHKLIIQEEEASNRGLQSGYEKGYHQGLQEAKEKQQDLVQQAAQILKEAYVLKEQIVQEAEPTIIDLSMTVAKKIILREIDSDPDIVKRITIETLKKTKEFEQIMINVDPNYFAYIQSARDELLMELNGNVELSIFPDSSIQDAGIMIKTSQGTLDARIDTQLEELKQVLLEVISRRISS